MSGIPIRYVKVIFGGAIAFPTLVGSGRIVISIRPLGCGQNPVELLGWASMALVVGTRPACWVKRSAVLAIAMALARRVDPAQRVPAEQGEPVSSAGLPTPVPAQAWAPARVSVVERALVPAQAWAPARV